MRKQRIGKARLTGGGRTRRCGRRRPRRPFAVGPRAATLASPAAPARCGRLGLGFWQPLDLGWLPLGLGWLAIDPAGFPGHGPVAPCIIQCRVLNLFNHNTGIVNEETQKYICLSTFFINANDQFQWRERLFLFGSNS